MTLVAGITLCVSLPGGFDYVQALAKFEIRPQHQRGNIYGQGRAQQPHSKARDHYQKTVAQGVKIGNTEEWRKCSSISERWDLHQTLREAEQVEHHGKGKGRFIEVDTTRR